jgi:hypothetical protein
MAKAVYHQAINMTKPARTRGVVLLALFLALAFWWVVASDYSDAVARGKYHFGQSGVVSSLVLKPDHTFQQELKRGDQTEHSQGTWRTLGQSGVSFSKEFLPVPGEEVEPDGTTFADIIKPFGLLVTLQIRQYHVLWYGRRATSAGKALVGTYDGDEPGVTATLTLKPDQSFEQEIAVSGFSTRSHGTWAIGKNGEVNFSRAFLKTSGESLKENESAVAENPQDTNLQIAIRATSKAGSPTFHKHQAPW